MPYNAPRIDVERLYSVNHIKHYRALKNALYAILERVLNIGINTNIFISTPILSVRNLLL